MRAAARVRTRRWSRTEYRRLLETGILQEDDPIELLSGRLVVAEPHSTPHATSILLVSDALRDAFGPGWSIRVQLPLALGSRSEPEPDVAVVRGAPRDHLGEHPGTAALVVEVALDSLAMDRGPKARICARAGIADYWIVNLVDRVLEVHRDPAGRPPPAYRTTLRLGRRERIAPLAAPGVTVAVGELLP